MNAEVLLSLVKNSSAPLSTYKISVDKKVDHQKVIGALKSLQATSETLLKTESSKLVEYILSKEGEGIVKNGSHEYQVLLTLHSNGNAVEQKDLMKKCGASGKIGFSKAMQKKWISMDKATKIVSGLVDPKEIDDELPKQLKDLAGCEDKVRNELKKRKLFTVSEITNFHISKGVDFEKLHSTCLQKAETELTQEMIATGKWKTTTFKDYNFNAKGIPPESGHLHPLLKVRSVYRQILLEMGFNEMPTNQFVESSFWNFDSLFQPQMHPARDAHDTFFISDPPMANLDKMPMDYVEKVRETHENGGGTGSVGYRYNWKLEESQKKFVEDAHYSGYQ